MNMKSKRLIFITALVVVVAAGGATFDHWRKIKQPSYGHTTAMRRPKPPLPQFGELLASADTAEITGKAYCGMCYWGVGEGPDNVVLKTDAAPGIVFLSPNEKVSEIERITGQCPEGTVVVKARGILTRHSDHNYLFVRDFSTVAAK